jgi:hypothetical protein
MNRVTFCLLLVTVNFAFSENAATAQDKIEGAFGKKLGEIFDPVNATSKGLLKNGQVLYYFVPDNPFRSITSYYLLTTPTTNKIYAIVGTGSIKNIETGKLEQNVLMELLCQKYGPQKNADAIESLQNIKGISQGNRIVTTRINGYADTTLDLMYFDNDLAKLAEKERVALETKKASGSGL